MKILMCDQLIIAVEALPATVSEFQSDLWVTLVDHVTLYGKKDVQVYHDEWSGNLGIRRVAHWPCGVTSMRLFGGKLVFVLRLCYTRIHKKCVKAV